MNARPIPTPRGTRDARSAPRPCLAALLAALAALACSVPDRPGPTRPVEARSTVHPQQDVEVAGLRLRAIDVGPRDAPAILLIPGHTSRIEEVDAMATVLAARHRVLAFDFPGSGYSEKPERDYTVAFYEDTAVAFLDAMGVGHAFPVGGSLGGNLVLRLGHRFPERFPRLAAWAPGSAWEARPGLARALLAVSGPWLFRPMVRVQSRYWYADDWEGRDAALRDTFSYYDEVLSPGFVRMYFGMAADQVARSLFPIAPEIAQPVWLGWGDRDHGGNMGEGVARLAGLLPDCELRVFPGAGHALASEIPERLAREIEAFLDRP